MTDREQAVIDAAYNFNTAWNADLAGMTLQREVEAAREALYEAIHELCETGEP